MKLQSLLAMKKPDPGRSYVKVLCLRHVRHCEEVLLCISWYLNGLVYATRREAWQQDQDAGTLKPGRDIQAKAKARLVLLAACDWTSR